MVGTRKGAFLLESDASRSKWKVMGPQMIGAIINHIVLDPRDGKTLLMAARTGHLGPTIYRSVDRGKTWKEATTPPAFPKAADGKPGRVVKHTFWLTPGHASQPGVWFAGTSPQALFRTNDGGVTWESVSGFNDHAKNSDWTGDPNQGPPDGATMHSILIDPRDADHMYIGMSAGGIFETIDAGASWKPLNKGVAISFMPGDPDQYEYGHDPHCVAMHPADPDRLYHQNHCGIYRLDRPGERWERIGNAMPKAVGDIGFPIVLHPRDVNTAWVFPMDGSEAWPRVSPGGKPAAFVTRNGGKSWQRLAKGLPAAQAWYTVKRQAMCADACDPLGLYFGTTSGDLWISRNEGKAWKCIARYLPHIYSVTIGELA